MPIRDVCRYRTLTRLFAILWLACVATSLLCEPALAQATRAKGTTTGRKDAGRKDTGKKPGTTRPTTPGPAEPAPEEAATRPKREDPYLHGNVDSSLNKQQVAKLRMDTLAALKNGAYEGEQQQSLATYYRKWALPSWTLTENYCQLTRLRTDLRDKELRNSRNGPPRVDLMDILRNALPLMANRNFHPAVRVNAMLAIGDLNEEEAAGGLPTPLAEAVPLMIGALTDEKQIEGVKVAAMVGLKRHVRLGIADKQLVAQKLVPLLLKLAAEKTPPAGRSADGHEWMRSLAMDMLGLLRDVGNNNVVVKTLGAVVADKKDVPQKANKEMLVRCAAASALGSLGYANASGLNPGAMAEALAGLAMDACARERAVVSGQGEGKPFVRRRLRSQINAASLGFSGTDDQHKGILALAQDTPDKDYVEKLYKCLQDLAASFDKKGSDRRSEIDDAELLAAVGTGAAAIATAISERANGGAAAAGPGAKPPAEAAKEPGKDTKPPGGDKKKGSNTVDF